MQELIVEFSTYITVTYTLHWRSSFNAYCTTKTYFPPFEDCINIQKTIFNVVQHRMDCSLPQRLHTISIQLLGNDINEKEISSGRPKKVPLKYAFRSRLRYICCNIIVSDEDVLARRSQYINVNVIHAHSFWTLQDVEYNT